MPRATSSSTDRSCISPHGRPSMFRTVGVLLYALMQVGFNLSLYLGLFGAISIVITLGLLPPYFWDSWMRPLAEKIRGKGKRRGLQGARSITTATADSAQAARARAAESFLLSLSTKLALRRPKSAWAKMRSWSERIHGSRHRRSRAAMTHDRLRRIRRHRPPCAALLLDRAGLGALARHRETFGERC